MPKDCNGRKAGEVLGHKYLRRHSGGVHQAEDQSQLQCTGSVSKKECIKKLRRAAMSLKKPFLQKVVGDLPRRINHVVQAKGSFTGKD